MDLLEQQKISSKEFKRHPWEMARLKILFFLLQKIQAKSFIGDVGSGDAFVAGELSKSFSSSEIAAVDINYGYGGVYSTPDFGFPEEGILSTSDRNIPGWHFETLDFELVDQVRTQGSVLNFRDQKLTETKFSGQEEIKICRVSL